MLFAYRLAGTVDSRRRSRREKMRKNPREAEMNSTAGVVMEFMERMFHLSPGGDDGLFGLLLLTLVPSVAMVTFALLDKGTVR